MTTHETVPWTPYRTMARIAILALGVLVTLFLLAELRAHLVGDVLCPLSYLSMHHEGEGGPHDPTRTERRVHSLAAIVGYAYWSR